MPIEEDIRESIQKFTFNKNLPEFIDMAKYLEGRLKEGENLLIGVDERELIGPANYTADFIYLELQKTEGKPGRVATLNCLGDITYNVYIFKDYRPLPESQREP